MDLFEELKKFKVRAAEIVRTRPDLASLISNIKKQMQMVTTCSPSCVVLG
jgi:hypothetical protein